MIVGALSKLALEEEATETHGEVDEEDLISTGRNEDVEDEHIAVEGQTINIPSE